MKYSQQKWILWLVVVMLIMAVLACGGSTDTSPTDTSTDTGSDTDVVEEPTADSSGSETGEGTASLEVINNTDIDLCYLFIADNEAEDFGPEQLGENTIITAGTSYVVEGIEYGTYKLKIHDCDGNMVHSIYGATMEQAELTWTIEMGSLIVVNESSFDFCELYISPNSAPETAWGINQIEGEPFTPGQQITFSIANGSWDMRATPCDGTIEGITELGLELDGELTWTISDN